MQVAAGIEVNTIEQSLKALPGALPDRVIQAGLAAAARVAAKHAQKPDFAFTDRSGRLRASIKARSVTKKFKRAGTVRFASLKFGGPGARQSNLIELGSKKAKARAPLGRAVNETEAAALHEMLKVMDRRLRKLGKDSRDGKLQLSKTDYRAAGMQSQLHA